MIPVGRHRGGLVRYVRVGEGFYTIHHLRERDSSLSIEWLARHKEIVVPYYRLEGA